MWIQLEDQSLINTSILRKIRVEQTGGQWAIRAETTQVSEPEANQPSFMKGRAETFVTITLRHYASKEEAEASFKLLQEDLKPIELRLPVKWEYSSGRECD